MNISMASRVVLIRRRGFASLMDMVSDLPLTVEVVSSLGDVDDEPSPQLVLFLCDHPDAFGDHVLRTADRWPLTEVVVVDSEWGISACRTRTLVPSGWRVDEPTAIRFLEDIAAGRRMPTPRPRTYSRQERACEEPLHLVDWPYVDANDPAVAELDR